MRPELIDDRRGIVLLLLTRDPLFILKENLFLPLLLFLRLRDGRDVFRGAAVLHDAVCWLSRFIELPVLLRVLVRRIQDRLREEGVGHEFGFRERREINTGPERSREVEYAHELDRGNGRLPRRLDRDRKWRRRTAIANRSPIRWSVPGLCECRDRDG